MYIALGVTCGVRIKFKISLKELDCKVWLLFFSGKVGHVLSSLEGEVG